MQEYAGDMSGGTKMSQQGNATPGRSDNGAVTMPPSYPDAANYFYGRNGYLEHEVRPSSRSKYVNDDRAFWMHSG